MISEINNKGQDKLISVVNMMKVHKRNSWKDCEAGNENVTKK